jgi:hypothetical protein
VRKPRSDAKLKTLPEDQYQALVDWLLAGTPYRVVKQRLSDEFGVETSNGALSDFWNDCCGAALVARRQRAVSLADEIADEAASQPGRFDQATIDALKQKAFELAVNPQSDPRDVKGLFGLVLKARDQEHDERSLRIAEQKFRRETCELFAKWAQDQRALEIAVSSEIGADEKTEMLGKLIFGEDW